jgi:hypothetical protein
MNWMVAMCNIPFYSFPFPLSNLFWNFLISTNGMKFSGPKLGSVKLRKTNISNTFFFTSSIKAPKLQRPPKTFVRYGDDSIAERTAQKRFACFKQGNFDTSDTPCLRQPYNFDEDLLNALIHVDPRQTTRELASEMGCDHATIVQHLKSMGKVQNLEVWVPHILT